MNNQAFQHLLNNIRNEQRASLSGMFDQAQLIIIAQELFDHPTANNIVFHHMDEDDAIYLLNLLVANAAINNIRQLSFLSVLENQGALALADLLRNNHTLTTLSIVDNGEIGPQAEAVLHQAIMQNTILLDLDWDGNFHNPVVQQELTQHIANNVQILDNRAAAILHPSDDQPLPNYDEISIIAIQFELLAGDLIHFNHYPEIEQLRNDVHNLQIEYIRDIALEAALDAEIETMALPIFEIIGGFAFQAPPVPFLGNAIMGSTFYVVSI